MGLAESFGILYPAALYLLAIPPLLILAYLARERPRQAVVSSVLAFRVLHAMRGERFGRRPRLNWMFLVELLILCLAALVVADPYIVRRSNPIAVVMDNSAAMQARGEGGRSRLDQVRERIARELRQQGSGQFTLYVTTPRPHQIGRIYANRDDAISALNGVAPTDQPDDPAAVASLLGELRSDRRNAHVIVASYRPLAAPLPSGLVAITANQPVANYAIGSFTVRHGNLGSAALLGQLTIANFSPASATLAATVSADGRPAASQQSKVGAGQVTTLDFKLPPASSYRAELGPADAFPLDNVAYALGSGVAGISILFVSPVAADGAALRSIPGVSLTTVPPASYSPSELRNVDLVIFEYTVPKQLPQANALLVMPPPGDPVFDFAVYPTSRLELTGWPPLDPLTDGVNFRLLNMRSGQYFAVHRWMRTVVGGAGGGLMLAGERNGHRFVALGFNPFPYLGRENLPMSILTLNILSHLAGLGGQSTAARTGQPWLVPAGVETIELPSGQLRKVQAGEPFTPAWQGIYTLSGRGGVKSQRAVNLADLTISNFETVVPLKIPSASTPATKLETTKISLAPYLLGAVIALIVLESLLVYRRRWPTRGVEA